MENVLLRRAQYFPAVTITGPRQSGKSTLCRMVFPEKPHVNLETPDIRAFAREDPRQFLSQFPDGAILDEFQRAPELASNLQAPVDEEPEHGRWIPAGSEHVAVTNSVAQSRKPLRAVRVADLLDANLAIVTGGEQSQSRGRYDVVSRTRLGEWLRSM